MAELLAALDASWRFLVQWATDAVLFPALQLALVGFVLLAALVSAWQIIY